MKTVIGLYDQKNEAQKVKKELDNSNLDSGQIRMMQSGNVKSSLTSAGVPEHEADLYAEGVRRGGTLVTINVDDDRTSDAVEIMNRHDPVDIDRRVKLWRDEGWSEYEETDYDEKASERDFNSYREREHNLQDEAVIPVIEEDIDIAKRQTSRGGVRIKSQMREIPVEEQVTLRQEHVDVERRKVNRDATAADLDNFKEGTIEMTETSEEAVVTKSAHVVEEVVVDKDVEQVTQTVKDTVRRTDVDVERTNDSRRKS